MRNKLLALVMVTTILATMFLVSISTVNASILEVGPGKTYSTIQAAIDAAGSGDTIMVYPGMYGPFNVSGKVDLTVVANVTHTVVVNGSQSVTTSYGDRYVVILVVNSINITLEGLDIEGYGLPFDPKDYGVIYDNSSGTIRDCIVSPNTIGDMTSVAIAAWEGSALTVDSCTIQNYGRVGVFYYSNCTGGVYDSTIIGQVYSGEGEVCYGIEVHGVAGDPDPNTASQITIKGNEIYNHDNTYSPEPSWASSAIYINGWMAYYDEADSTVAVEFNQIHDNYNTIYAVRSPTSYAHYNNIEDNRVDGVCSAPDYNNINATFDAKYNYWGDASGPTHSSNPGGVGEVISDYVDYSPWLGDPFEITPRTYHVNPTGTIQEAVDEASSGDKIVVAAGIYGEQVVIDKDLTLEGAGDTTIIQPLGPSNLTKIEIAPWIGGGTKDMASILWADAPGNSVTVKDLKIDGINVDSAPPGLSSGGRIAGVAYIETSGLVDNVTVVNMNTPSMTPRSVGIWTSAGTTTSSVQVTQCNVTNYNRGGIYSCGDQLTVDFNHNTIRGPGTSGTQVPNGIFILAGSTGSATYNNVTACGYSGEQYRGTGIGTYDAGTGITFAHNIIHNVQNAFALHGGSGVTVEHNTVHGSHTGVRIESGAASNIIQYNNIVNNTYAMRCGDEMGADNEAHYNNFIGNNGTDAGFPDYVGAVSNIHDTNTLNATLNYWGDSSGPSGVGPGTGDSVSENVDFEPWLLEPYPPATPVETLLYVSPASIECWTPSYGETFLIEVKIDNVTDFYGYEFKLYWDTSLLDLSSVETTPPWSKYFAAKNETREDLGRYWISIVAYDVPSFNGSASLAKLTFKMTYDPIYPENKSCTLDLVDTKLSAPFGVRIYHMAHDGNYILYSTKPKIAVQPSTSTVHSLNEIFEVNITVLDVVGLYEFNFTLSYNTTLLDTIDVQVGPFLQSPRYVHKRMIDDANGLIWVWVWSVDPAPPSNGSGILATITFKAIEANIWPEPQLSCNLALSNTILRTNTGYDIPHDTIDGMYVYDPKPGDVDMDGEVGLTDLRIVAYYYDPGYNIIVDLNRDGTVDLFDLSIVASYYGEDC